MLFKRQLGYESVIGSMSCDIIILITIISCLIHTSPACLMLVFEETLLKQITDIIQHEKHNQTWVPINCLQMS